MRPELENCLHEKRFQMDVEEPDDSKIWAGIKKELSSARRSKRPGRIVRLRLHHAAALLLLMLSLGYIIGDLIDEGHVERRPGLASIDFELGQKEREYRRLVAYKMEEASAFNHIDNLIIAELFAEIRMLDTIYEKSLRDLEELGFNEQAIQTIFDTYEKKIYLLELIILENNKAKNHEDIQSTFL